MKHLFKKGNTYGFKKSQIPWNKGLKIPYKPRPSMQGRKSWNKGLKGWRKNYHHSEKTRRKISLANKGRKCPWVLKGKKCYNWKGSKVGYWGLHKYISRHLGRPTKCEHCGKIIENLKFIHWANKSHLYRRDFSDWLRLCSSCHKIYDKEHHLII